MEIKNLKLAIIGLGYVGLPIAVEFSKKRSVIGFDIKKKRIQELKSNFDKTLEVKKKDLKNAKNLELTSDKNRLRLANCFIVTVPTPVDKNNKPDLGNLRASSIMIGKILKKKDIIIYESTVYPGCTEEYCVPILEKFSGLKFNKDFFCGYSPERINPGDMRHRINDIVKVTSGSTKTVAKLIDRLYNEIISAGTFRAESIKVAEAAKVIENTQRDINIALINELTIFFDKMNIDTESVLTAAATKWNFLNFRPGLVGGHCIGVDPYYLTYKAKSLGYDPKIILAGRELNDKMHSFILKKLKQKLKQKSIDISKSKILIMGLSFKENCPDIRNSGVRKILENLMKLKAHVDLYDPWVQDDDVFTNFGKKPIKKLRPNSYDIVIIAVAHSIFKKMGIKIISKLCKKKHIIYDLKYLFKSDKNILRL